MLVILGLEVRRWITRPAGDEIVSLGQGTGVGEFGGVSPDAIEMGDKAGTELGDGDSSDLDGNSTGAEW